MKEACRSNDLSARLLTFSLCWGIPIALFAVGSNVLPLPRMAVWTIALAWAGTACAINARRCGRLHCYITGPLFLLGGLAFALVGLELVALPVGWILVIITVGACLAYALEFALNSKYLRRSLADEA